MDVDVNKILRLKEQVEKLKQEQAQAEGRLKELEAELEKMGINSIEEAEAALGDLEVNIIDSAKELNALISEVENALR